jgi:hypothetical protein
MNKLFAILYINVDEPKYSEILGIFDNYDTAVAQLIKSAFYEERDNNLLQYKRPTNDYNSYDDLYNLVYKNKELVDFDIFRIEEISI